jgi:hypothetical protein
MVMMIGGLVWNYSMGASTLSAEDYVNDTMSLVNEVTERFMIEHVTKSDIGDTLKIWVFNYGDVSIVIDVYVEVSDGNFGSLTETFVDSQESKLIEVDFTSDNLDDGDYLVVRIVSRRQNYVYNNYIM